MSGRATLALAAALATGAPGCATAIKHPAIASGVVAGALGFATCKLASDDLGACVAVGGGAGAFLGLVAAAALWLGGPGNTAPIEETAQPLPEDSRPARPRPVAPVEPAATPSVTPAVEPAAPASTVTP